LSAPAYLRKDCGENRARRLKARGFAARAFVFNEPSQSQREQSTPLRIAAIRPVGLDISMPCTASFATTGRVNGKDRGHTAPAEPPRRSLRRPERQRRSQ